jgi:hypothetical protein
MLILTIRFKTREFEEKVRIPLQKIDVTELAFQRAVVVNASCDQKVADVEYIREELKKDAAMTFKKKREEAKALIKEEGVPYWRSGAIKKVIDPFESLHTAWGLLCAELWPLLGMHALDFKNVVNLARCCKYLYDKVLFERWVIPIMRSHTIGRLTYRERFNSDSIKAALVETIETNCYKYSIAPDSVLRLKRIAPLNRRKGYCKLCATLIEQCSNLISHRPFRSFIWRHNLGLSCRTLASNEVAKYRWPPEHRISWAFSRVSGTEVRWKEAPSKEGIGSPLLCCVYKNDSDVERKIICRFGDKRGGQYAPESKEIVLNRMKARERDMDKEGRLVFLEHDICYISDRYFKELSEFIKREGIEVNQRILNYIDGIEGTDKKVGLRGENLKLLLRAADEEQKSKKELTTKQTDNTTSLQTLKETIEEHKTSEVSVSKTKKRPRSEMRRDLTEEKVDSTSSKKRRKDF